LCGLVQHKKSTFIDWTLTIFEKESFKDNKGSFVNYQLFMQKALDQARNALAKGEFPVGCIIEYKGEVLVTSSRIGTIGSVSNEVDHAEMIALKKLTQMSEDINRGRAVLFSTMEPCLMCLGATILSGIGKIVYAYEDVMGGGTQCSLHKLTPLYAQSPISVVSNIMRPESLALFKAYFQDPDNHYWKGSLLATYTLNQ